MSDEGNAFGVFCNAGFESIYRENMAEARAAGGCSVCVDVGHEPMCGHRAWGGDERPKPETPNTIIEDDVWPWVCTREPGHEGLHVGCSMDDHHSYEWGPEECLRSAPSLMVTVSLMMEIMEAPIPGKFVRRPDSRLISRPGDVTMLPVTGVTPNPNGTFKVRTLTPWEDCQTMEMDCPESILKRFPNTRFCEGDMMAREKIARLKKGNVLLRKMRDEVRTDQDLYENCSEVAESMSQLHPVENDHAREFFEHIVQIMSRYEQEHGMAY